MVRDFQEEGGDDLHHGKRSTGVPRTRGAQCHQVVAAHQAGSLLEFFNGKIADNGFRETIHERHVASFLRAWRFPTPDWPVHHTAPPDGVEHMPSESPATLRARNTRLGRQARPRSARYHERL